jgi:hypothetical protein
VGDDGWWIVLEADEVLRSAKIANICAQKE